ncbi:uncharacterized protein LOC132197620 [Neocloeon triangulifer]|uniref:uncharacterized protein LOC132197620 n=1 Tax=Neocloeon triangulifer TaxID=2078957 RepID=UPI00286F97F2|nr:uncharacterized protein LOC132197620 [Neocloeon triangulifer]
MKVKGSMLGNLKVLSILFSFVVLTKTTTADGQTQNFVEAIQKQIESVKLYIDERLNQTLAENLEQTQNFTKTLENLAKQVQRDRQFAEYNFSVNCTRAHEKRSISLESLIGLSNGKKYYFSWPLHKLKWVDAKAKCIEMGLHLATVRSQADLDAIWEEAKSRQDYKWWWVSAKNFGSEDNLDFRWHDGTELVQNSTIFEEVSLGGECVNFNTSSTKKKLEAWPCYYYYYFVCELPTQCY